MSLNEMALERLARTAPELTRFVISFKDMTDELPEGGSVQVGVFVIRRGAGQFFIPVVAKSGTVYPIDSIYIADRKCFFPLTNKTVEQLITNQNASIGKASRIPETAVRNPNLKDLIVPPRTGKFVYAGTSRLGEMMATLKPSMKTELISILENDASMNEALNRVLNVPDLLEALKAPTTMVESTVEGEFPQVITDGHGLGHAAVQDILNKGYHVKGSPVVTRVAVESFGGDQFTTLSAAEIGRAYAFVTNTGDEMHGVVLCRESRGDYVFIATETGNIVIAPSKVVIKQQEVNAQAIMDNIPCVNILNLPEIMKGDAYDSYSNRVLVCDGKRYFPLRVNAIVESDGVYSFSCRGFEGFNRVVVSPGMHGSSEVVGDTLFLNPHATAAVVSETAYSTSNIFERDLSVAIRRDRARKLSILPECHTIRFHKGFFSYDGHAVGDKPAMAKKLIEEVRLDTNTAEHFMKKASEDTVLEVFMSKEAAEKGSNPTPMVEYGEKLPPDEPGTGTSKDRARNSMATVKKVTDIKDQQVVEATIMSELLSDPDMIVTIGEYLPDIENCIDKMGRVLFLSRVNSDKLSEQMDPEALSNLITTIRNSYRNLGENYIKLENLSRNV